MKYLYNTSLTVLGFYLGIKIIEKIEDKLYEIEEGK